jgi:diguanylate cyclase (GGDEF)-like protein
VEPVSPEHARRPLGRLEHALRGQPEALIFAGAALAVLALFVCDYALPAEVRLHGLYVFPLAIAAHYCARLWCSLVVLLLTTALQCAGYALEVVPSAALSELGTQLATSVLILFLARAWRTNYLAAARQASLDPLTNLGNRRAFFAQLEARIRRQRRGGGVFSLAVLDLDGFKALNDSQGHRVGDEALKLVAEILRARTRASDALGRIGGDEFGILMPDGGGDCAAMLRELCTSIARRSAAAGCAVTASIGCQTFQAAPEDTADAWQQADRVMYEAKLLGKNRAEHCDRGSRAA